MSVRDTEECFFFDEPICVARLSILGFGLLHFGRQLLRIFLFGIEPIALYEYAAASA